MAHRTIGVEIEFLSNGNTWATIVNCLRANGLTVDYMGYSHQIVSGWKLVTDGSVSCGFELVSPISKVKQLEKELPIIESTLEELNCSVNKSCGLHVHVSAADYNLQSAKNLFKTYQNNEIHIDKFMANSRRANNAFYCRSTLVREISDSAYTLQDLSRNWQRYCKINFNSFVKYGTIEFRQHQGTTNATKIINWVKLLVQLVTSCKKREFKKAASLNNFLNTLYLLKVPTQTGQLKDMWNGARSCDTLKAFKELASLMNWPAQKATYIWTDVQHHEVTSFFTDRARSFGFAVAC